MFDQLVVIIVSFFTIIALFRGFIRELLGIIGLTTSVMVSYHFSGYVTVMMMQAIPLFIVAQLVSVTVTFLFAMICTGLIGNAIASVLANVRHGMLDTILGGILGFAKGYIVCFVIYLLALFSVPILHPEIDVGDHYDDAMMPTWITQSHTYPILLGTKNYFNDRVIAEYESGKIKLGSITKKHDDNPRIKQENTKISPQQDNKETLKKMTEGIKNTDDKVRNKDQGKDQNTS